jgi:hypothetical protein
MGREATRDITITLTEVETLLSLLKEHSRSGDDATVALYHKIKAQVNKHSMIGLRGKE